LEMVDGNLTGAALLEQLATQLIQEQAPATSDGVTQLRARVVESGTNALERFRQRSIIAGTIPAPG